MRVEHQQRAGKAHVCIVMSGRSWPLANKVIEKLREEPPDGYKLVESKVSPKHTSGLRVRFAVTFRYVDDRVDSFTTGEAMDWFADYQKEAMGE